MFEGKKKIIFLETDSTNGQVLKLQEEISKAGLFKEDYILSFINPRGSNWEHYFEYMACKKFSEDGYLLDLQIPWNYHGRPDFAVYSHEFSDQLRDYGWYSGGAFIQELSSLSAFGKDKGQKFKAIGVKKYEFRVGEVKSQQKTSQIMNYLKVGVCNSGYEFMPDKRESEEYCGLISISNHYDLDVKEPPTNPFFNETLNKKDMMWFQNYLKANLIGNLSFSVSINFASWK